MREEAQQANGSFLEKGKEKKKEVSRIEIQREGGTAQAKAQSMALEFTIVGGKEKKKGEIERGTPQGMDGGKKEKNPISPPARGERKGKKGRIRIKLVKEGKNATSSRHYSFFRVGR